ncbi:MAG TPA: pirin family protein [Caulobacterales bacterium]|jgi:redox-sensitive bicupin YhaK (pirin superfamily)|nr:pirin family protein [Caulobacterales bacterium]
MIEKRPFSALGAADHDWLKARYHFSFSDYHDPARMHWGALRVWNDDTIRAKSGFPPHSHANMEIITYVRTGAITHQDSMGNKGRTGAGDVQVMSAGAGVTHAEYNLEDEDTTLFQIWILPRQAGGQPYWKAAKFPKAEGLKILASGFDDEIEGGALPIRQDARVIGGALKAGETAKLALQAGRNAYLVLAKGRASVNGVELGPRDGAALRDEPEVKIEALEDAEIVVVDAP